MLSFAPFLTGYVQPQWHTSARNNQRMAMFYVVVNFSASDLLYRNSFQRRDKASFSAKRGFVVESANAGQFRSI